MKMILGMVVALLLLTHPAGGAEGGSDRFPAGDSGKIYGLDLMTPEERENYREKLWEMKTEAERERFRREHHERMRDRAREMNVRLPDDPVYLDRPFFEEPREETDDEKGRRWPSDGLRRWPPDNVREEKKEVLRRWPEAPVEEGDDRPRSWASQGRREVIRPETEADAEPRLPPGSGIFRPTPPAGP